MIVLASASPRRQELLKTAGVQFIVKPANIPEVPLRDESAPSFAERMAREKARKIWQQDKNQCVLGADTVVAVALEANAKLPTNHGATGVSPVESQIVLGKPENASDAARMLRLLSGRKHQVITGVCLITAALEDIRSETTAVYFSEMTESEIRDYIASGEPMDKAGAYAIQGVASRWVQKIEGDYSNVVGLPVELVLAMLHEHELI